MWWQIDGKNLENEQIFELVAVDDQAPYSEFIKLLGL